jgi:hypothetical protein
MFVKNIELPLEISLQFKLQLEALRNKKEQKLKRLFAEETFFEREKRIYSSKLYRFFFTKEALRRKERWLKNLETSINETKSFIENIEDEIEQLEKY